MPTAPSTILSRPDTLLGICEALGDDFGFNPLWLRTLLACGIFYNLAGTIALYLTLGIIVAAARWLHPAPVVAKAAPAPSADVSAEADAFDLIDHSELRAAA